MDNDCDILSPAPKKCWVCKICFLTYTEDIPFEDLPEDWCCPVCGSNKSCFDYV